MLRLFAKKTVSRVVLMSVNNRQKEYLRLDLRYLIENEE